jgi:hypothetical protein
VVEVGWGTVVGVVCGADVEVVEGGAVVGVGLGGGLAPDPEATELVRAPVVAEAPGMDPRLRCADLV